MIIFNRGKGKSTDGIEFSIAEKVREIDLESKVNGRNQIMALNTCAVFIMRYSAGMLIKWNKNELQEMG